MGQKDANYAVARIDLPNLGTHGWQIRLQRRGKKYAKFFSDSLHGGTEQSLRTAREWRDALIEEISSHQQARICTTSPRNSSGVVGVSKVKVVATNGNTYEFWQATWSPTPGQRKSVKFSITRHGNELAFQLAIEARNQGVQ